MLGKGYTVNLHRFSRVNTLLVPVVAVINCHVLSGLKQHNLIFFQLKGQKSKWVCRPAFFLGTLGENPFPFLFLLLRPSAFLGSGPLPLSSEPAECPLFSSLISASVLLSFLYDCYPPASFLEGLLMIILAPARQPRIISKP